MSLTPKDPDAPNPRFCATCGLLLDPTSPAWFYDGDSNQPEHFACRRARVGLPSDAPTIELRVQQLERLRRPLTDAFVSLEQRLRNLEHAVVSLTQLLILTKVIDPTPTQPRPYKEES